MHHVLTINQLNFLLSLTWRYSEVNGSASKPWKIYVDHLGWIVEIENKDFDQWLSSDQNSFDIIKKIIPHSSVSLGVSFPHSQLTISANVVMVRSFLSRCSSRRHLFCRVSMDDAKSECSTSSRTLVMKKRNPMISLLTRGSLIHSTTDQSYFLSSSAVALMLSIAILVIVLLLGAL